MTAIPAINLECNTTCPYCGVGCGVTMKLDDTNREWRAKGLADHPANFGRLCVKGSALGETLTDRERLLYPEIDGVRTDWAHALETVASRLNETIARYGSDSVAFYVSGQLLTEDYYVANKLMKGFIGSANIDTNSRLCMSSAVAAHKKVLGADAVPGCYRDLEQADLVILTGSNMAWTHPVVYQRLVAAKQARPDMKVVVIDPRVTATCDLADLHLPIAAGSDGFLFTGLLAWCARQGVLDETFIKAHTHGFADCLAAAEATCPDVTSTARHCEVPEATLQRFFELFAATPRTVTVFSQGINQSDTGVDKASAILHCHLATGRIGKPGATPFSITGQPNAMGGREVGGLANQLAAHMGFDDAETVARFWSAPQTATAPGLKAVDLFRAVESGRIKAIWIMATNPVVSMPEADRVRQALAQCPTVIVSDCVADTDTLRLAHVRLPAAGWGEKDGTVTNSERRISRQRAFLPLPGDAKPDWWIISAVARKMGFERAFSYTQPSQIFREHAALSGYRNEGRRAFDISALACLTEQQYDELQPVQWPLRDDNRGNGETSVAPDASGTERLFTDGQFYFADRRARFVPITPRRPQATISDAWPWLLNTGRIRDQWHTMTRTGRAARLLTHISEPFVAVHPEDMTQSGLEDGELVCVQSALGECVVTARATDAQTPGQVFMPIHWNDCFASAARVDSLVDGVVDHESGQPAFKQTPVRLSRFGAQWQALVITAEPVNAPDSKYHYWCRIPDQNLVRWRLAGVQPVSADWLKDRCPNVTYWAEMIDAGRGHFRLLGYKEGRVVCFAALAPELTALDEEWLAEQLRRPEADTETQADSQQLIAGCPGGQRDTSPVLCSCHQVREAALETAVQNGCTELNALCQHTRAGTGCGSCLPELKSLIAHVRALQPEEAHS
ncbi:molybdopterin-dependent oxidoreductase [Marinimicrobium sp. ARAG 43.8]|uniref:nitrate reductase n=1 Tax=Marinimicrobium sp. ARAG 43.8 TaxID=3418719 RepID=UPI003CE8A9BD